MHDQILVTFARFTVETAIASYPVSIVLVLFQRGSKSDKPRYDLLNDIDVVVNLLCFVDEIAQYVESNMFICENKARILRLFVISRKQNDAKRSGMDMRDEDLTNVARNQVIDSKV